MKKNIIFLSVVVIDSVLFIGCNSKSIETTATAQSEQQISFNRKDDKPKKGDNVPNSLVCMVNDTYMGKEQLKVLFEGKTYYGCCKMCQEKIPNDESVRYATDPYTLAKVDKANAYIILIGDNGEVAYFENKNNYENFKKE